MKGVTTRGWGGATMLEGETLNPQFEGTPDRHLGVGFRVIRLLYNAELRLLLEEKISLRRENNIISWCSLIVARTTLRVAAIWVKP